jgi:hypothetical protein
MGVCETVSIGTFGGTEMVPAIIHPLLIVAKAEYVETVVTVTTVVGELTPDGCQVKENPAEGDTTARVQVFPHRVFGVELITTLDVGTVFEIVTCKYVVC